MKSRVQLVRAHGELPVTLHATATRWEPNVKIALLFFPDSRARYVVLPPSHKHTMIPPTPFLHCFGAYRTMFELIEFLEFQFPKIILPFKNFVSIRNAWIISTENTYVIFSLIANLQIGNSELRYIAITKFDSGSFIEKRHAVPKHKLRERHVNCYDGCRQKRLFFLLLLDGD